MPDTVQIPGRTLVLGDKKTIGLEDVRNEFNATLAGTTGVVNGYDSSGTQIVTNASLSISLTQSNTRAEATYGLITGSGGVITTAGDYRFIYKLTFPDGSIYQWEQEIVVKAVPF